MFCAALIVSIRGLISSVYPQKRLRETLRRNLLPWILELIFYVVGQRRRGAQWFQKRRTPWPLRDFARDSTSVGRSTEQTNKQTKQTIKQTNKQSWLQVQRPQSSCALRQAGFNPRFRVTWYSIRWNVSASTHSFPWNKLLELGLCGLQLGALLLLSEALRMRNAVHAFSEFSRCIPSTGRTGMLACLLFVPAACLRVNVYS
jgi:hypothetical protein